MSRIGSAIAVACVLVVAGATTVAAIRTGDDGGDTPARGNLPPATVTVTKQTLLDQEKVNATLGYGRETSVSNKLSGTVTALAETGEVVHRGEVLYRVDNLPVVLLYGTLPIYRALAPDTKGVDVEQFERELRNLGYTGFTVDKTYDSRTAAAVKKWQKKLGLTETGTVEVGRVVYASGEVRVATQKVAVGDEAAPGSAVLSTTGTARVVVVRLNVKDQRLVARNATVKVDLPDGKRIDGRITKVTTIVDVTGNNPVTKLEVTIGLATAVDGLGEAAVQVLFTVEERKDVLTVPVAALLALVEGGYGVQVVEGGSTRIVAVQTGLFSNGRVEIRGAEVSEGMTVGMPT
jgi:multidrug efflux system membrane fusion protein